MNGIRKRKIYYLLNIVFFLVCSKFELHLVKVSTKKIFKINGILMCYVKTHVMLDSSKEEMVKFANTLKKCSIFTNISYNIKYNISNKKTLGRTTNECGI